MKKNQLILSAMLVLMSTGAANAQKAYTYVQQNGTKLGQLGTAAFEISAGSQPTITFDENGKAVMKIGDNKVAILPMNNNGQLVIEFETELAESELNKVTKTNAGEYGTIFSPFQLVVPEGASVDAYAPTYDKEKHALNCTSETRIAAGSIIPCETGLILHNPNSSASSARRAGDAGEIVYAISAGTPTVTPNSALSGSSLQTAVPELGNDESLYALDYHSLEEWFGDDKSWEDWFGGDWSKDDWSGYDFYEYIGENLDPGSAWLVTEKVSASDKFNFIDILFDDEETAISELRDESLELRERKYIENGRVVILKNGKKYNTAGQQVK